jgi:uncharacterized membrane protein (UPF0182 family)
VAARRSPRLLFLAALALLFGVPSTVALYTDWLWFGETGYQQVFVRSLGTRSFVWTVVFVPTFLFLAWSFRRALSAAPRREMVIMTPDGPRRLAVEPGRLRPLVVAGAALAALALAAFAARNWLRVLLFQHGGRFGVSDPILGYDVGFHVFTWPLLQMLQQVAFLTLFIAFAGAALAYVVSGLVGFSSNRGLVLPKGPRLHLSLLAAGLFLALAFGDWLGISDLLTSRSSVVQGASYVDVYARIPALRVLMVAGIVAAALAVYQAFSTATWPIAAGIGLYVFVSIAGSLVAGLMQRFIVAPNEQARETPFIAHNIRATLRAYALDGVATRSLSGDAALTRANIEENASTLENVPLWDHQPLLDTFSQVQEIRTYYDFTSVDNDRYRLNGRYRQIMLSARELNSESLPNRNWINEHFTFTHGYGLTLGPVNEVTAEGLPVLFIKNLPPESSVDLKVSRPALYFGELSNDHVFVRTRTREFHYPSGDDNVFTTYDGDGGIPVGSFWRQLLFAIKFRSLKTVLPNDLTADSRVLMHRRIADRVRKIAPFLQYDRDPYLAIADGRLYWIQDAYTTAARYPYSTAVNDTTNYIRNSVKVVIDAYSGRTIFYLLDRVDPVAATLDRTFPDLFRPLAEMPEGLRTRLRYPQDIFAVQSAMFATYHMQNPAVFYNREDQWEVPAIDVKGQPVRMEPYYTIMKLPGAAEAEFIQMLPFTPRQKDNLAAWMVARSDGPHYGKLAAFQFPKQKVVFGPRQVVARINQDQVIAPQITLWNQQGSEVIQGTLLVIPIEESLIYVRPLYLRASGNRITELTRVIVVYQDRIVMEETLGKGLDRIFPTGGAATDASALRPAAAGELPPPGPLTSTTAGERALILRASQHYERALAAQRAGDWTRYGEEIKPLGAVLAELSKQSPANAPPR